MAGDGERGDVILSGLFRLVAGLLALGIVLFDSGAVVVNRLQLDEAARNAARAGAATWAEEGSARAAEAAVRAHVLDRVQVDVGEVGFSAGHVVVTVSRPAPVLLLDRLGPIASWAEASATSSWPARAS